MRKFGLIGKNIDYSFSRTYFKNKFQKEKITDATYENFDLDSISFFNDILNNNKEIKGLNVTIPYKETVIPFLDKLSNTARKIGAVNTIKITKKGKRIGYNTDAYGFEKSLKPLLKVNHTHALILGTGGASKAVAYSLKKLKIKYNFVSRRVGNKSFCYNELNKSIIQKHLIIINTTPLGTFPDIDKYPKIPYEYLSENHILFDLIYNPVQSKFLKKGIERGCKTQNGLNMLAFQAEKAWRIWNK